MADPGDSSPLIAPVPAAEPKSEEIDLEAGPNDQIQCRICLETDGDFYSPIFSPEFLGFDLQLLNFWWKDGSNSIIILFCFAN